MKRINIRGILPFLALVLLVLLSACSKSEKPSESLSANKSPEPETATSKSRSTETEEPLQMPKTNEVTAPGISGKIILKGTPPPERDLPLTPDCGKLHAAVPKTRFYVVGEGGALSDVFVYIKEGLNEKTFNAPSEPVLLDQSGCEYTPYVIGLQTGQKLLVRNSDPLMHNVHVMPKISGNKESNKAQMMKSPDLEYTFNAPEIFLTYKCDVHPWMFAYVGVVEHPFFAVSGKDGTFHLKNVPDGKYTLEAVHRKAGKQTKEITVTNGKASAVDFTFEIPASL